MAKNVKLITYVQRYLVPELRRVRARSIGVETHLSVYEQTLIFKYSEDGYEAVNQSLRDSLGKNNTQLGEFLEITIAKLPDYKGLAYRSANLGVAELQRYMHAFEKNTILVEHSFISASTSYSIANMYGGNCKFEMICKSGKEIEKYSKYGLESGQNEYEVLFGPNCEFIILEITKMSGYTLIIMEEI